MHYSFEEYKEGLINVKYNDSVMDAVLEDAHEALSNKTDIEENCIIIACCCGMILKKGRFELIKEGIDMCNEMLGLCSSVKARGLAESALATMYIVLQYQPKVVEHFLNFMNLGWTNEVRSVVTLYSSMSVICMNSGLYDKALEFNQLFFDRAGELPECDPIVTRLILISNKACILAAAGRTDELALVRTELDAYMESHADNEYIAGMLPEIRVFDLYFDALFHDFDDEMMDCYIQYLRRTLSLTEKNDGLEPIIKLTPEYHEVFMNKLLEKGRPADCIEVGKLIMASKERFMGAVTDICGIIVKAGRQYPELIDRDEFMKFSEEYILRLENERANQKEILQDIVRDEFRVDEINRQYSTLRQKYETDQLTGCYNRPGFEQQAPVFFAEHPNGSLIFMDVDNLKKTNDMYSHSMGDFLLKSFVKTIQSNIDRNEDNLYRYAGDEFIIVSSKCEAEAAILMTKIEKVFENSVECGGGSLKIEFSYGIASFDEPDTDTANDAEPSIAAKLLNVVFLADSRMYECKRRHKNARKE